jgi:hypothetical protein
MSVDVNSILSGGLARTLHTLETDLVSGSESESGAKAAPTQNTELYNTSGPNANEPSLSDIQQGSYGDCYFLSSLGALARNDPNAVKNMIHDNGNGTYTVTFHVQNNGLHNLFGLTGNSYTTQSVTVSASEIPNNAVSEPKGPEGDVTDASNGKRVIWPAVVEAAYAKMNDTKIFGIDLGIQTGYQNIGNGGWPQPVLQNLTGHDAQSYSPTDANELNQLQAQFNAGKLITVCTPGSDGEQSGYNNGNPYNLIGAHAYTVTNVYQKNGQTYVTLNNPWGMDQPQDIPLSALAKVSDNIAVGTIH